jgi:hypothetical protein
MSLYKFLIRTEEQVFLLGQTCTTRKEVNAILLQRNEMLATGVHCGGEG